MWILTGELAFATVGYALLCVLTGEQALTQNALSLSDSLCLLSWLTDELAFATVSYALFVSLSPCACAHQSVWCVCPCVCKCAYW